MTAASVVQGIREVDNNPQLDKRIRVEHEYNSNMMGNLSSKNIAGEINAYNPLPSFYSDLFEIRYEAVGELTAKYKTVIDWKEEFHEGVIYYSPKTIFVGFCYGMFRSNLMKLTN